MKKKDNRGLCCFHNFSSPQYVKNFVFYFSKMATNLSDEEFGKLSNEQKVHEWSVMKVRVSILVGRAKDAELVKSIVQDQTRIIKIN